MILVHMIILADGDSKAANAQQFLVKTIIGIVTFLLGYLVTWLKMRADIAKARAEVAKLQAEAIDKAGETLKTKQEKRAEYRKADIDFGRLIGELTDLIRRKDSLEDICQKREACCAALFDVTIPAFRDAMEWEFLTERGRNDATQSLIQDQVIPTLRRFADWKDVVNLVAAEMNRSEMKASHATFVFYENQVRHLPTSMKNGLDVILANEIERLRS